MSRHRRQASRVLPPDLTWEGEEQPPKSTVSAQSIATTYGRQGSNASTTHASANPSTTLHQDYSSGNQSLQQAPQNNPSATTKPSLN
ncbi:hypothetical protein HRI_002903700 [Hibiscus trionum]|uniref:Uncharacterized protein n=1 Tax=Hibiscus trionum TaxID=183268 RepID=A0A9W7M9G7_HIBTR|nr:hypothetical protein HRI_002903700 [Hibiscus trionum]